MVGAGAVGVWLRPGRSEAADSVATIANRIIGPILAPLGVSRRAVVLWRLMSWSRVFAAAALAIASAGAPGPIAFDEVAEAAGLRFVTDSSPSANKNQPETMVA